MSDSRKTIFSMRMLRVAALCMAALVLFARCTAEKRYQTLSFFFDGVPRPGGELDEAATVKEVETVAEKPAVITFKHQPFAEGKCDSCHAGSRMEARVTPSSRRLCRKCHEDFNRDATYWHGPVAAWACLECHSAHETKNEHLLLEPIPAICSRCHDLESEVFLASADAHRTEENCTRCHEPHGSKDRFLLKAEGEATGQQPLPDQPEQ